MAFIIVATGRHSKAGESQRCAADAHRCQGARPILPRRALLCCAALDKPCLPARALGTARLAVPVGGSESARRLLWRSSCSSVPGQEQRSRAPSHPAPPRPDTERSEDTLSPWPRRWQAKVYLSGQRNPYTGNPTQLRPASGAADITGNIK